MSNYQLFQNDLPNKVLKSFKGDISIDTETLGLNIKREFKNKCKKCFLYKNCLKINTNILLKTWSQRFSF